MSLDRSPRKIVPIRKSPPYIGARSVSSVYELIRKDPKFAALWFSVLGRTLAYEDTLTAYTEARAETTRKFAPVTEEKRGRGRPRKLSVESATESC